MITVIVLIIRLSQKDIATRRGLFGIIVLPFIFFFWILYTTTGSVDSAVVRRRCCRSNSTPWTANGWVAI